MTSIFEVSLTKTFFLGEGELSLLTQLRKPALSILGPKDFFLLDIHSKIKQINILIKQIAYIYDEKPF